MSLCSCQSGLCADVSRAAGRRLESVCSSATSLSRHATAAAAAAAGDVSSFRLSKTADVIVGSAASARRAADQSFYRSGVPGWASLDHSTS